MKKYKIAKFVVFIALAISIIFLMDTYIEYLDKFIGGLIVLYAVDSAVSFFDPENKRKPLVFCQSLVQLILGVCTIFVFDKLEVICVIWAVWSILREAGELEECYHLFKEKLPCLLSTVESIVAIVFSILLIKDPGEHHAKTHMILLIIELSTAVIFPQLVCLYAKYIKKEKTEE